MPDTLTGPSTSDPALVEDLDDDNDGLNDTAEESSDPVTDTLNPDTDGDGYCDGPVSVTINDVFICEAGPDDFPLDPTRWINMDRDGDGVDNEFDDFPDDPSASKDTDGDGMPDTITGNSTSDPALIEDLDDDNDGLSDIEEDTNGNGAFDDGETLSLIHI